MRRWFLTYIYCNFQNTFFGLSNLELFIESLYASSICLNGFFCCSFKKFSICIYYYYYYYYYYHHYECLCVLYVHRSCWETCKISSRFESCLYSYFRTFYFCIVELWVLVNLKYKKNQTKTKQNKKTKKQDVLLLLDIFPKIC